MVPVPTRVPSGWSANENRPVSFCTCTVMWPAAFLHRVRLGGASTSAFKRCQISFKVNVQGALGLISSVHAQPHGNRRPLPGEEPVSWLIAADIFITGVPVRVATLQFSVFATTGTAARGLAQLVSELVLAVCVVTEYSIPLLCT